MYGRGTAAQRPGNRCGRGDTPCGAPDRRLHAECLILSTRSNSTSAMSQNSSLAITVFGSGRPPEGHAQYEEARALGRALAAAGFLVCSGGYGGVMEAVSRGAKEAGGGTLGVTASALRSRLNRWVDEEVRVATWEERLFELVRRGDGYVACKGGTGTLVELAVVWEMLNKRVMSGKPFAVLGGFWQPVLDHVRNGEASLGLDANAVDGSLVRQCAAPADAAEYLSRALLGRR